MDRGLLEIVSNYLGEIPILNEVRLLHSPNSEFVKGGSQEFHFDKEAKRSLKVFFNFSSNDPAIPSQQYFSAEESDVMLERFGLWKAYNRFSDQEVAELTRAQMQPNSFFGQPGDVFAIDTCRCLHCGSRPATSPRLCAWAMFLPRSHYRFPLNVRSYNNRMRFASS